MVHTVVIAHDAPSLVQNRRRLTLLAKPQMDRADLHAGGKRPDVEVMDGSHTRDATESLPHRVRIDLAGLLARAGGIQAAAAGS